LTGLLRISFGVSVIIDNDNHKGEEREGEAHLARLYSFFVSSAKDELAVQIDVVKRAVCCSQQDRPSKMLPEFYLNCLKSQRKTICS
jgi:hypothetical protein